MLKLSFTQIPRGQSGQVDKPVWY